MRCREVGGCLRDRLVFFGLALNLDNREFSKHLGGEILGYATHD